jgi:hypothetical protein
MRVKREWHSHARGRQSRESNNILHWVCSSNSRGDNSPKLSQHTAFHMCFQPFAIIKKGLFWHNIFAILSIIMKRSVMFTIYR